MGEWLGSGLPPSALARIQRATDSGFSCSQLAIASQLAVASCGFEPVGSVVGCTVKRWDRGSFGLGEIGCGYLASRAPRSEALQEMAPLPTADLNKDRHASAAGGLRPATMRSSSEYGAGSSSHVGYAAPAHAAWRSAIDRMLLEATALHADGVVDVVLSEKHTKVGVREFVATGTAVRSMGQRHLEVPFATTLLGGDVVKLMTAGWMPASIVLGLSVAVRHDTFRARIARGRMSSACELVEMGELVHAARQDARKQVATRTREIGADGAVLTCQMTLLITRRTISRTHHDIVAEARATATAIVEFASGAPLPTEPTSVIPLTG